MYSFIFYDMLDQIVSMKWELGVNYLGHKINYRSDSDPYKYQHLIDASVEIEHIINVACAVTDMQHR